jgi:hypothetical protein
LNVLIDANTMTSISANNAIDVTASGSGALNATIRSNTITLTGLSDENAIFVISGTVVGDTVAVCAQIGGAGAANALNTLGPDSEIRVRQFIATASFRLPGYGGSATDDTAVQTFLLSQNTAAAATATHSSTGFQGGSACTLP